MNSTHKNFLRIKQKLTNNSSKDEDAYEITDYDEDISEEGNIKHQLSISIIGDMEPRSFECC